MILQEGACAAQPLLAFLLGLVCSRRLWCISCRTIAQLACMIVAQVACVSNEALEGYYGLLELAIEAQQSQSPVCPSRPESYGQKLLPALWLRRSSSVGER